MQPEEAAQKAESDPAKDKNDSLAGVHEIKHEMKQLDASQIPKNAQLLLFAEDQQVHQNEHKNNVQLHGLSPCFVYIHQQKHDKVFADSKQANNLCDEDLATNK